MSLADFALDDIRLEMITIQKALLNLFERVEKLEKTKVTDGISKENES